MSGPQLFPGLIYRMIKPKVVLLIFVSGKIVLTGAKVNISSFISASTAPVCQVSPLCIFIDASLPWTARCARRFTPHSIPSTPYYASSESRKRFWDRRRLHCLLDMNDYRSSPLSMGATVWWMDVYEKTDTSLKADSPPPSHARFVAQLRLKLDTQYMRICSL